MQKDNLRELKKTLECNNAHWQLMMLLNERVPRARVMDMDFEFLKYEEVKNHEAWGPEYNEKFTFKLGERTLQVEGWFDSWGDSDVGTLLYNIEEVK